MKSSQAAKQARSPYLCWEINKTKLPPDPEIAYFWDGPSPPRDPPEKVGGFAPHLFRRVFGRGKAVWTPEINDFWVGWVFSLVFQIILTGV